MGTKMSIVSFQSLYTDMPFLQKEIPAQKLIINSFNDLKTLIYFNENINCRCTCQMFVMNATC